MAYTPQEYKAIAHYSVETGSVPQLSVYPQITFKSKKTGKVIDRNIHILVGELADYKKQLSKDNKRSKIK